MIEDLFIMVKFYGIGIFCVFELKYYWDIMRFLKKVV